MMSIHHQTENYFGKRPINAALRPSIFRSIDRSRTPGSTKVTLHVLLGLQRSCESYLARRESTLWLDLIKAFYIAELSIMFALLWIVYYQGMEWNGMDFRITTPPSLTLVLPCN